jgi:hypothetical protein
MWGEQKKQETAQEKAARLIREAEERRKDKNDVINETGEYGMSKGATMPKVTVTVDTSAANAAAAKQAGIPLKSEYMEHLFSLYAPKLRQLGSKNNPLGSFIHKTADQPFIDNWNKFLASYRGTDGGGGVNEAQQAAAARQFLKDNISKFMGIKELWDPFAAERAAKRKKAEEAQNSSLDNVEQL